MRGNVGTAGCQLAVESFDAHSFSFQYASRLQKPHCLTICTLNPWAFTPTSASQLAKAKQPPTETCADIRSITTPLATQLKLVQWLGLNFPQSAGEGGGGVVFIQSQPALLGGRFLGPSYAGMARAGRPGERSSREDFGTNVPTEQAAMRSIRPAVRCWHDVVSSSHVAIAAISSGYP